VKFAFSINHTLLANIFAPELKIQRQDYVGYVQKNPQTAYKAVWGFSSVIAILDFQ